MMPATTTYYCKDKLFRCCEVWNGRGAAEGGRMKYGMRGSECAPMEAVGCRDKVVRYPMRAGHLGRVDSCVEVVGIKYGMARKL